MAQRSTLATLFPRDGLLIPKERKAESRTAESSWPRSAVKWPDVFFSFSFSFSFSFYFFFGLSSFHFLFVFCLPTEWKEFAGLEKRGTLFTEIDSSDWSSVYPYLQKELTEGHEQSRNEAREGVGTPLISWLAASTSIFRRSNNGCNVPLKIHLVIGGVVLLPSPFFLRFFWVQLKWLLSGYWGWWYKWYWFYFSKSS